MYSTALIPNWIATGVTANRMFQYQNRLIALNLNGAYLGENLGNVSLVWSTPITQLGNLEGIDFQFTSSNSAGDDVITETVGEVLDGAQLGEYLIIYKEDAVLQYTDTGEPLYLSGTSSI